MGKKNLKDKIEKKEERIKKLLYENITLVTENMKLEYENRILRKRVEILEIFSEGYGMKGIAQEREDYVVILINRDKGRYLN